MNPNTVLESARTEHLRTTYVLTTNYG